MSTAVRRVSKESKGAIIVRKILSMFLVMFLLLSPAASLAEEGKAVRRAVRYPGQDISLAIPAQYVSFYKEDIGLTILIREKNASGYLRARVMPAEPGFS